MTLDNGDKHYDGSFYTRNYGAHRWDTHLNERPGTWFLVTNNLDFDYMRGIEPGSAHITCVVDDFGSLVRVSA